MIDSEKTDDIVNIMARSKTGHTSPAVVTLRDVALKSGVSLMTVSRALQKPELVHPVTRDKVMKQVKSLGYTPNAVSRSLRQNRTHTIGLIFIKADSVLDDPFFMQFFQGAEQAAAKHDLNLLMAKRDVRQSDPLKMLRERRVDGLIIIDPPASSIPVLESAWKNRLPFVVTHVKGNFPWVDIDHYAGMSVLIESLAPHREKTAYVGGHPDILSEISKKNSVTKAARRTDLLLTADSIFEGSYTYNYGYEIFDHIFDKVRPDLIIGGNDLIALGLMGRALERGQKVPGDLWITGYDNIPESSRSIPQLTTVDGRTALAANEALELLVLLGENETSSITRVITPDLVPRESAPIAENSFPRS